MDALDGTISTVTCVSSSLDCMSVNMSIMIDLILHNLDWSYDTLYYEHITFIALYLRIVSSCIVYCIPHMYIYLVFKTYVHTLYLSIYIESIVRNTTYYINRRQNQASTPSHNKKTHIEWKKNAQLPSPTPPQPRNKKPVKKQGRCSTHRHKTTPPKNRSWPPNIDVVEQLCSSVEKIRAQNGFPRLPLQVGHSRVWRTMVETPCNHPTFKNKYSNHPNLTNSLLYIQSIYCINSQLLLFQNIIPRNIPWHYCKTTA